MIDSLRAEFPTLGGIAALRRPTVLREPTPWAFVSAIGGGFVVGSIVSVLMFVVYPVLFPTAESRPEWLSPWTIVRASAGVVVGAVAVRAGGVRALLLYVLYELLQTAAALPGRQLSCSRFGGLDPAVLGPCDLPGLIVSHWPAWLALVIGAATSRWLLASGPEGANRMLRAAGVFGLVLTTAGTSFGVLAIATLESRQPGIDFAFTTAYLVAELVAGVVAGLILSRSRSAAVVLVALLVLSGLAATLPNIRANWIPNMPLQMAFLSYSGAFAPVVGGVGIVVGWIVGRRRPA